MSGVHSLMLISLLTWTTGETYPQMTVSCVEAYRKPQEWFIYHNLIPSHLRDLRASLIESRDPRGGHLEMKMNISWAISIDHSNEFLTGTWITINNKCFRCVYQPPFKTINTTGYEELWFHFTNVSAEPGNTYLITGENLPTSPDPSEPFTKHIKFQTDDCTREKTKYHQSCVERGSLWKPNVTAVFRKNEVKVQFTSSPYSTTYKIVLWRNHDIINTTLFHTAGEESRWTQSLSSEGPCDFLFIDVRPQFKHCHLLCRPSETKVTCSKGEDEQPVPPPGVPVFYIIILLLLLTACILAFGTGFWAYSQCSKIPHNTNPTSVLIIYPAKNNVFQRAVVSLAEFLKSCCKCRVLIDVWQRGRVAELGLLHWLAEQIDSAEKVIFVIARKDGTRQAQPSSSLSDFTVPASVDDVFSLALNIVAGHARDPTRRKKYLVVHLGDHLDQKSLPEALNLCKSYCLMRDLSKLCRNLHGMHSSTIRSFSRFQPLQDLEEYAELNDAIRELQKWQQDGSGCTDEHLQLTIAV